jgi:class 3 adenylate cyclase
VRRTGCHHARCWGFLQRRIALDLREAGLVYRDLSQALLCLGIKLPSVRELAASRVRTAWTLGTIGFEGRFDYAAIGTVSNVASRLRDEAKPGQILISPRVLVAIEDAVQVEPVGDKGIRRPLAAYNVIAAIPPNS